MFDPFKPQAYNVEIGAPEMADVPIVVPPPPEVPYAIPVVVPVEKEPNLYPDLDWF